jgi:hypothetical protein
MFSRSAMRLAARGAKGNGNDHIACAQYRMGHTIAQMCDALRCTLDVAWAHMQLGHRDEARTVLVEQTEQPLVVVRGNPRCTPKMLVYPPKLHATTLIFFGKAVLTMELPRRHAASLSGNRLAPLTQQH